MDPVACARFAIFASALGMGCGASSSSATQSTVVPATSSVPAARRTDPTALLDPYDRLRMPVEGIPCEGPDDALLTVVEYVGYECPFTRRMEPDVQRVLRERAGDVRFCVRQMVIPADQPHGLLAAHVALETFRQRGARAFFRVHRALLAQPLDDSVIIGLALGEGVDEAELREALASNRHAASLTEDRELLRALNRSGTPELFIAGRLLAGAKPHDEIAAVFDEALDEARRLVAGGVAREELYSVVQRDARDRVSPPSSRPGEPERVRIRFIDVATSLHPLAREPRTMAEARRVAENIAEEVRAGAEFGPLAQRWSAASNAARGGEFGWVSRGTLTEETEDLAMSLGVGEVGLSCTEMSCRVVQRVE